MIGYDTLPETLPPACSTSGGGRDSAEGLLTGKARSILMGQGLTEVYSHTLSAPSAFDDPAATENRVKIRSALSAELSGLRQSLVPGLLETLARNARLRNHRQSRSFEVGSVFWTGAGEGYSSGTPRRRRGARRLRARARHRRKPLRRDGPRLPRRHRACPARYASQPLGAADT